MNISKLAARIQADKNWMEGDCRDSNPYNKEHQAVAYEAYEAKWFELEQEYDQAFPREVA
jgi:hypothetical protein